MKCGPRKPVTGPGIQIDIPRNQYGATVLQGYTRLQSVTPYSACTYQATVKPRHVKPNLPGITLRSELPSQLSVSARKDSQNPGRRSQRIHQA